MSSQYRINLELAGDLDSVARVITLLRKCRNKVNVKEIHVQLNGSSTKMVLLIETSEIEWFVSKLSTIYEVQELFVSS